MRFKLSELVVKLKSWQIIPLLFLLLCLLQVHGFSLGIWNQYFDRSYDPLITLFKARGVRSDDWGVSIPSILSQVSTGYRLNNPSFGFPDHDMRLLNGAGAPMLHYSTLFRPALWGYFLGAGIGLSWHWFFQIFALIGGSALFFRRILKASPEISFLCALHFSLAPFFQLWSFNAAMMVAAPLFALLSIHEIFQTRGWKRILWSGVLFLSLGSSAFTIYPPYQVSLFLFCAPCALTLLAGQKIKKGEWDGFWAIAVPVLVLAAVLIVFYRECFEVIQLHINTAYPGKRASSGGDLPLSYLFSSNFFVQLKSHRWVQNICESARFFLVWPVLIPLLFYVRIRKKIGLPGIVWVAIVVELLALSHMVIGLPAVLRHLLLLDWVPGPRMIIVTGLCDSLLLCFVLSRLSSFKLNRGERYFFVGFAFFCTLVLSIQASKTGVEIQKWFFIVMASINGFFYFALFSNRSTLLKVFTGFLIASSAWFNPIVVGGAQSLLDNPLAQAVLSTDGAAREEGEYWLVLGENIAANYLRILGVPALNGTHYYPQVAFWKIVDPEGRNAFAWNRYGHLSVNFDDSVEGVRVLNPQADLIELRINPKSDVLHKLGVRNILVNDQNSSLIPQDFSLRHQVGRWKIFTRL